MVEVLAADPGIEIVGEADDGKRGIELCQQLRPDVITLDMMLPVMSGLAATEFIMAYCPTPILIVSASTNRGELFKTYEALAAGALDVLDKPLGNELDDAWERKLVTTVKLLSRIKVITHLRARLSPMGQPAVGPASIEAGARARTLAAPVVERHALQAEGRLRAVAIGVSTGGPAALIEILRGLPRGFPLPILLVIHIGKLFAPAFAEWLDGQSP
ncbi:MAG TPA: response regulator, partial [Clostridia bacterium]|nr:response regulator [Clostridia bacterium]